MDVRRRIQIGGIKKVTSGGDDVIPEPIINMDNYLTIEALEDGLTASLSVNTCEYCVDGDGNWKTLSAGTATQSINSGHTLSFRGNLTPATYKGIGTFTISKKCNLKGNCMSMLFGDNAANNYSLSGKNYAFCNLFNGCINIVNVCSNFLPATTLANYCYQSMFVYCTSLTTAPELPATTLAQSCYSNMFKDCKSLATAPELPAIVLNYSCYEYMFNGCKSLTTAPELPARTLANYCYNNMFQNCKSLTTAPELPATTLTSYCYEYMFNGCTNLTTAPELPATTLTSHCYYYMFEGCTSLTTSPELHATTLADSCYGFMFSNTNILPDCSNIDFTSNTVLASRGLKGLFGGTKVTDNDLERLLPKNHNGRYYLPAIAHECYRSMFQNCKSLTTAPELPARTIANYCYDNMFNGCTNLTTAPELPARTLANYCYRSMFEGCTSLTTSPELPATTLTIYCYNSMFTGCKSLTTAPKLPATTLASNCYNYMFNGCSKLNYIKMLATDISATKCLDKWVYGVASTGTFIKNPAMTTLSTGQSGIPSGWTVVNDGEESGGNLITFTIEGIEYQAEEGMTWEEWVDSEYSQANDMPQFGHGGINNAGCHVLDSSSNQITDDTILYDGDFYTLNCNNDDY